MAIDAGNHSAQRVWVLDAMAWHRHIAPHKTPTEPSPPPAPTLVSSPSKV